MPSARWRLPPSLPGVDRARIGVGGASQGGALALAAAALCPELVRLCHADVPFLCDIERGMDVAFDPPYTELVTYLAMHPELDERARLTLRHVDNALLASRIEAPTLISVALRDTSRRRRPSSRPTTPSGGRRR